MNIAALFSGRSGIRCLAAASVLCACLMLMWLSRPRSAFVDSVLRMPFGTITYHIIGEQFATGNPNDNPHYAELLLRIIDGKVNVSQNDPHLVDLIRKYYILPPSVEAYNMVTNQMDTSMGQAAAVNNVLRRKRGGFFVECGALDGETRSNTYYFETSLDWSGILIEADPSNFVALLKKHRKVYSLNACLSPHQYPLQVDFKKNFNVGQIAGVASRRRERQGYAKVICFPFYSIMLALNRTRVDYFSLDVEGAELDVLRTIPFVDVDVQTLSVEYYHVPGGEKAVRRYMKGQGFSVKTKVTHKKGYANDLIFVA